MDNGTLDLERFMEAQDNIFARAWSELNAGRKVAHWMSLIFPHIDPAAQSEMSLLYGLHSLEEARAYIHHPILGERLRECTQLLLAKRGADPYAIFGYPDDVKFHSSMTLFACACEGCSPFHDALNRFFHGKDDAGTVKLLQRGASA